jgi:membrane dipeptidase
MYKYIFLISLFLVSLVIAFSLVQSAIPFLMALFLTVFVIGATFDVVSTQVDKSRNKIVIKPPYRVDEKTASIYQTLFVVDLHADPLLWKRDLLKRSSYGQVDIPRMVEGNLAFQVFGIVTKSTRGQNFEHNRTNAADNITLLAITQFWPPRTWNSRFERALYQAQKLENIEKRSKGQFVLVRSVQDLDRLVEAHRQDSHVVGGFTMLEGAHGLDGKLENLDRLYDAGVRIIGLAHFFDNDAGGSAHGAQKNGLTPFGRALVQKAQEKRMILDLAHSSPQVIDDVLGMTHGMVIASHTGVRGTCDSIRNLTDNHIRGIAAAGGVIGIAMFATAVGEASVEAVANAIHYVTDLVGVDYAAVGGDMDGSVTTAVDVSGMPLLTEALLRHGFNQVEIAKIMGGNALRVMRQVL